MKKFNITLVAILCLFIGIVNSQTFETIDILDWNNQIGLSGFTPGGTTWSATGNEARNCDTDGFFGIQGGAFVINDWEGTCGCDCGPDDPNNNCGQNDSQIDFVIAPGALNSYCQIRVQIPISTSGTLECGTANDQNPDDIRTDQCMDALGPWAGADFMTITYDVLKSDGSREVVFENICGDNGIGTIEHTFEDAQFIQVIIRGGTQEADEFYEIGNITVEGVTKQLSSLSIFAINHAEGFICENSALPLILQTNADLNYDFVWTGPNSFVSTESIVQFTSLDPTMTGTYSVQVTDDNGCVAEGQTNIVVRAATDAECTSSPEFNLFPIICSDETLPSTSDNGIAGSWSPGADLSQYAGQTLEFTFRPDDSNIQDFMITLEVDDLDRLQDFAIQPNPTPVFCNASATRYDFIEIFQMNLDLSLTVNGDADIFFFIDNNETVSQVEAQMRSLSFQGITPGNRTFFIDGVSPCGEFNQLSFDFIIVGDTDPVVIDTTVCEGDVFTYLGIPITQDTVMNAGECGGGIEINLDIQGPVTRRVPLVGNFCITDKVYVYDTTDANGNYIGITSDFLPEYEEAIDTIFSQSTDAMYTLPFPASNGCDSIVRIIYTFPSQDNIEVMNFDLCANKDTLVNVGSRDYLVSAGTPFYEIRLTCDESVIIDANILPVEVDSIVRTFCADQDTLIEDFDGNMVLFNRDNPDATFFASVGANGCSESKVIDLTFIEPVTSEVNEVICLGQSVIVGNQVFTTVTTNQQVVLSRESSLGCDSIVMVNIDVIDADIPAAQLTCDETQIQLNATHNGSIVGWTGPNGFTTTDASPSISTPGTYTVMIEGPNGCTSTFSQNITQDIIPPTLEVFGGEITCNNNGEATLSMVTNGTLLEWTGPNGFVSDIDAPIVTIPGIYEAEVIGANGCTTIAPVEVTEDVALPSGSTINGVITCASANSFVLNLDTDDTFVEWTGSNGFSSTDINAVVTMPDTYQALIRGANGCENTVDLVVTEDIVLPQVSGTNVTLDCNVTSSNLIAQTDATILSWDGPDGFSSTEISPSISAPGEYIVTVMGANGCENTAAITVTEDVSIEEINVENVVLDCNVTQAQLTAITNGTIEGWTGPNGFVSSDVSPSITDIGTYEVTVRGANGCTNTAMLEVSEDIALPEVQTENINIDCNSPNAILTATTTATIVGWVDSQGMDLAGDSPSVGAAGDYVVTVMGSNGCTNTAMITVSEDFSQPEANALGGELNCLNNQSLDLSLDITSGSLIGWSGPNGFTSSDAAPTVTSAGQYEALIRGDNGCEVTVSAVVNENLVEPTVTAENLIINCTNGGQTQLIASTDDNIISWDGPGGFNSTEVSPLISEAGTYTVTVEGMNGCTNTTTLEVTEDLALVEIEVAPATLTCELMNVSLSATTAGTILGWTGPSGFTSSDVSPAVSAPGDYIVTAIGANGCENTAIISVGEDIMLPEVSVENLSLDCNNTQSELSATTVSDIVSWDGPDGFNSTSANPMISVAGDYTVTVRGDNGCENTAVLTVSIDDSRPTLMVQGGALNCTNNQEFLAGTQSDGESFLWTGPGGFSSTEINPAITFPGTYTVTAFASNGCQVTETIEVTEDIIAPSVITNNDQLSCTNGATVELMFDSDGTFLRWEGPGGFVSNEEAPLISVPGSYTVYIQGANGCINSTTSVISGDSDLPTADVAVSDILTCDVTQVRLSATSTANIISWTDPNGQEILDPSPLVSMPGSYTVTVESATGCQGSAAVEVIEDVAPPTIAGDDLAIDCNNAIALLNVTTDGDIRGWRGPNDFISTDDSPQIDAAGAYEVEVEGANGCIGSFTIQVSEDFNTPSITVSTINSVSCQSAGAELMVDTDADDILWTGPGGFNSTDMAPMVFEEGTYVVVTTGANGCTSTNEIEISFSELEIEIGQIIGSCEGVANGMLTLQNVSGATPPFTLTGVGADPIVIESFPFDIDALATGDYNIEIITATGCSDQIALNIPEDRDATLDIVVTTIDPIGEYELNLDYDGVIADVMWSDDPALSCTDCPNPLANISENSSFTVTIIDEEGCIADAQVSLSLNDIEKIYLPNVMTNQTINGNNRFYPQGNFNQQSTFDMMIFDRWGNMVYQSTGEILNDPNSGWDGTYKGEMANSGVYVYSIDIRNEFGASKVIKGDITLIR